MSLTKPRTAVGLCFLVLTVVPASAFLTMLALIWLGADARLTIYTTAGSTVGVIACFLMYYRSRGWRA